MKLSSFAAVHVVSCVVISLACSSSAFVPGRHLPARPMAMIRRERSQTSPFLSQNNLEVRRQNQQCLQASTCPSSPSWKNRALKKKLHVPITSFINRLRRNNVWQWRAAICALVSTGFLFRQSIDGKLAHLWQYLLTSSSLPARIFRTDSYEWSLAVICFFIYIHCFWAVDRLVQKASENGKIHPWRKYRLQDRFEADKVRRMLDKRGDTATEANEAIDSQWNIKVKHSEWNKQGYIFELLVYCVPLLTWDILAPRRHRRLAPFGSPTTLGIMGGIIAGLLMYDFLFFCGHLIMHKVPFVYKTIHAKHHKMVESRAGEIVRLSLLEEVLEVGFSIVALNVLGVHPLARSIYNCIITFLLVELHCGFDFPWTPQNVVPFGLATGSRRHHYHHRNGRHYYQKFYFTFDRLFGFFHKDDGSLHGDSVKPDAFVPPAWLNAK